MDGAREGPARASPRGRSRSRSRSRRRLAMTSGRPEPSLPAMTDDDRNALAEKTSSKTCKEMLTAALRIRLESASQVRDVWRRQPCESLRLDYQEPFY